MLVLTAPGSGRAEHGRWVTGDVTPMNTTQRRRAELAAFLRGRRARVTPAARLRNLRAAPAAIQK